MNEITEIQKQMATQEITFKRALEDQRHNLETEKRKALDATKSEIERIYQARIEEMRKVEHNLEQKVSKLTEESNRLSIIADERAREIELHKHKKQVSEETYHKQLQELERRLEMAHALKLEREIKQLAQRHEEGKT